MSIRAKKFTSQELDSLLVPTFLRGLSLADQCIILEGSSTDAVNFRRQALDLYVQAHKAYRATQKGSCWNNYSVPWDTPSSPPTFLISYCSMAKYYCYLLSTPISGFSLLFAKIKDYEIRSRKCCPRGQFNA